VIYNPVLGEGEGDCEPSGQPPHAWLTDQSVPTFLFVGRLVQQKDPLLLLRAFALRLGRGEARLIVLGDGPLAQSLHQETSNLGVSHAVHFAGFVPDPGIWMEHAAALVVPSRYEGFGNVIVEALARGTPVIATDCPYGPAEILAGGRFGWLVPVGDAAALAAAMADDPRGSFPKYRLKRRAEEFSVHASMVRHKMLFDRIERRHARLVFGLKFSRLSAAEISTSIAGQDPHGAVRPVVSQNLDMLRLMREQPAFAEASRAASIVCADGFPVAMYAHLHGAASCTRVTGCDIFHAFAARAANHRRKTLVVAESDGTAAKLRDWANARGISGLWDAIVAPEKLLDDPDSQIALAARISDWAPDVLVMTLGAPTTEIFLHRHRAALPPCWALCCGQAVRVELGLAWRAPRLINRLNMEWAWRLVHEPRRLAPRYVRDALALPLLVLADMKAAAALRRKLSGPLDDQAGT
jgi:N-acetylglucosaminyldiphosphoundecaprenol N-acetyl-beta-D-mannosaminyltransferase